MRTSPQELKKMLDEPTCQERTLIRLMLACRKHTGIRLSAKEVDDIIRMDDALHQRIYNEHNRIATKYPHSSRALITTPD